MKLLAILLLSAGLFCQYSEACKRITGAILWQGRSFLFFGNTYVQLNPNNEQISTGDTWLDWRINYPDAAFVGKNDGVDYYFSDKYYFSARSNYAPVDARYFGGEFFANGLDAAGVYNGKDIFFKGCHFVTFLHRGFSNPMPLVGIPCNVDAALSHPDGSMIVFKDDKVWIMDPSGVRKDSPLPTSSMFHLDHSFKLCAEGEKEE